MEKQIFVFNNIADLPTEILKEFVDGMADKKILITACKSCAPKTVDAIVKSMSARDGAMFKEDLEYIGQIPLVDVYGAQVEIIKMLGQLVKKDVIEINNEDGTKTSLSLRIDRKFFIAMSKEIMGCIKDKDLFINTILSQGCGGNLMYDIEELAGISDREMQKILRALDENVIAMALVDANEAVQDKVYRNMCKRQSDMLKDLVKKSSDASKKDSDDAKCQVLSTTNKLIENKEIISYWTYLV